LPKFGSATKPIPSSTKVPSAPVCEKETSDQPVRKEETSARVVQPPKRSFSLRSIYQGWLSRIKTRLARMYVKPARAGLTRFSKTPVQTELSLDKVRVVRNDLSDTDLEVVPRRPSSGDPLSKASPGNEATGMADTPNPAAAPRAIRNVDAATTHG